jgi:hypothetical protein
LVELTVEVVGRVAATDPDVAGVAQNGILQALDPVVRVNVGEVYGMV